MACEGPAFDRGVAVTGAENPGDAELRAVLVAGQASVGATARETADLELLHEELVRGPLTILAGISSCVSAGEEESKREGGC